MTVKVDPVWYERYFGDDWLRIALDIAEADTRREVDFVSRVLDLGPGRRLVDVPCGHGRHAVALAGRGIRVEGFDTSPESIDIARSDARAAGVEKLVRFELADFRTATVEEPADAAMIMKSSFGFMASEEEDRRVLANVRQMLVPGGRLVMDLLNLFRLARTMVVPRRWEWLQDGTAHLEEREYDFRTGRRNVRVELISPDGKRRSMSHSIRIYTLHEIDVMLTAVGYRITEVFGGYDMQPFGFDTKRMIVLAERTD